MKYIVDKKDLKILAKGIRSTESMSIDEHIEEFCKELKHLELIIKGKVEIADNLSYVNGIDLDYLIGNKYNGKKIEIYVREVE